MTRKTDEAKPKKSGKKPADKALPLVKRSDAKTTLTKKRKTKPVINYPDTKTVDPVLPDKTPPDDYIQFGLGLGLSEKNIEVIEVYMTCYNATAAWQAVYPNASYGCCSVHGSALMRQANAREYLRHRMKQAFERTEAAQDALIQTYTLLAYGDVNELVQFRREACRYCHGKDHRYQWTPAEKRAAEEKYKHDLDRAQKNGTTEPIEPDFTGGCDFNPNREPHPDCPECFGEGTGKVHFNDTRMLSPAARALYEGAKIGKDGIEIKTASREAARAQLAKILKLADDTSKVEVSFSIEELDQRYAERMRKARERADAVKSERGMKE